MSHNGIPFGFFESEKQPVSIALCCVAEAQNPNFRMDAEGY